MSTSRLLNNIGTRNQYVWNCLWFLFTRGAYRLSLVYLDVWEVAGREGRGGSVSVWGWQSTVTKANTFFFTLFTNKVNFSLSFITVISASCRGEMSLYVDVKLLSLVWHYYGNVKTCGNVS